MTAAIAARLIAERQLGGRVSRSARRSSAVLPFPPLPFFSPLVGLRPVRPRASTVPAAVPRCLLRRLRFVWAMPLRRLVQHLRDHRELLEPARAREQDDIVAAGVGQSLQLRLDLL